MLREPDWQGDDGDGRLWRSFPEFARERRWIVELERDGMTPLLGDVPGDVPNGVR
jgi:hypothetical protein